eukprot:1847932-Rhodomonas_salina.1
MQSNNATRSTVEPFVLCYGVVRSILATRVPWCYAYCGSTRSTPAALVLTRCYGASRKGGTVGRVSLYRPR